MIEEEERKEAERKIARNKRRNKRKKTQREYKKWCTTELNKKPKERDIEIFIRKVNRWARDYYQNKTSWRPLIYPKAPCHWAYKYLPRILTVKQISKGIK